MNVDWPEVGRRIGYAVAVPAGLVAMAAIAPAVILLGQPGRGHETLRGMSRTLSGLADGNGDVTFSAWSWWMVERRKKWGVQRVRFVDWLNREPGHSKRSYEWHKERGLFNYEP